ncbi:unnamed protein product [Rotaria sordida]|uniref:G-protein coupled receptors family 1 profile domain-containing protein n=1 Tax=Rotaria sordida TaxID=392033 RepID=A0A819DXT1_9BILA|nr:unnamed protein product [Rotaria sordida]
MTNSNSTEEMLSVTRSFVPNIILDSIGIGLCIIAVCKTFIFIILILIRRQLTKSKDKILFLLSFNMYMSIFIFSLFLLDMFISMIKGHLYPDMSQINDDTLWCRLKVYLSTVALISSLYSTTIQALYRFFRITYYNRYFFYVNIYFYIFILSIQVIISSFQPLPILLIGDYQYEDYHCQINLTNGRGILMAAFLIWLLPVSITVVIYVYTLRYIRQNSSKFTQQQQTKINRNFIVIKRILWLIIFILVFGMPACSTTIVFYLFGYVGWWANHLTWLTFILSFIGNHLKPANRLITNRIDRYLVKYLAYDLEKILRGSFSDHISKTCTKTDVSCLASDILCPWLGPRYQLNDHLKSCPYQQIRPI